MDAARQQVAAEGKVQEGVAAALPVVVRHPIAAVAAEGDDLGDPPEGQPPEKKWWFRCSSQLKGRRREGIRQEGRCRWRGNKEEGNT